MINKKLDTSTLLLVFLGLLGAHRFYTGRWLTGTIMFICTISLVFLPISLVWWLVDLIIYVAESAKSKEKEQRVEDAKQGLNAPAEKSKRYSEERQVKLKPSNKKPETKFISINKRIAKWCFIAAFISYAYLYFVNGTTPLDSWETFIQTLQNLF